MFLQSLRSTCRFEYPLSTTLNRVYWTSHYSLCQQFTLFLAISLPGNTNNKAWTKLSLGGRKSSLKWYSASFVLTLHMYTRRGSCPAHSRLKTKSESAWNWPTSLQNLRFLDVVSRLWGTLFPSRSSSMIILATQGICHALWFNTKNNAE